jgi:hypothetical protein
MRTVRRAALFGLVVVALACAGCGPSDRQVGGAMLIAAPFVLLALYLVQAGLLQLWRRIQGGLELQTGPVAGASLVVVLLAALTLAAVDGAYSYAGLAFMVWGTSALTMFGLFFRLGVALRMARTPTWAPILGVLPGVFLACTLVFLLGKLFLAVVFAPGYMGAVAAPFILVLFIEAMLHVSAARRRARDEASLGE